MQSFPIHHEDVLKLFAGSRTVMRKMVEERVRYDHGEISFMLATGAVLYKAKYYRKGFCRPGQWLIYSYHYDHQDVRLDGNRVEGIERYRWVRSARAKIDLLLRPARTHG